MNTTTQTPLLSLCIPTWNRGNRLALLLDNIEKEIKGLEQHIEVVIADNASDDDTATIITNASFSVTYGRQQKTVGITNNIFFATCALATGRFIWIIGDDDLIAPGGLAQVIASIQRRPDIGYHYVNFCAIDADYRDKIIQIFDGVPPESSMKIRQCDEAEWQVLENGEDLAFLPGYNPSSLFSSLFCYVTRREFYLKAQKQLTPSNSLDGSSRLLDDMFPQALITIPNIIGQQIAYIGSPCILQGAHTWEWNKYLCQISILGIHNLLNWMESTGFDTTALKKMRDSHARTIATKLPPMLLAPDQNFGLDNDLREIIARYTLVPDFWYIFTARIRDRLEVEFSARQIARHYRNIDAPSKRVALLGERRLREQLISSELNVQKDLIWVGFNDQTWTGQRLENGVPSQSHNHHIKDQNINILILATSQEDAHHLIASCMHYFKAGTHIIDQNGITTVR